MKKFLTAFLLTCSCALVGAAVACKKDDDKKLGDPRSITFSTGEGYKFYSNAQTDGTAREGSLLTFEIELGAFYAGNLTAYVNDTIINPDADGVYSYTVGKEDLSIRVEGVRKDISNMMGAGTLEDAYVVSKPIDLLYIAERVNSGDRHFATASYVLANDIDCKGEELAIIGDYSMESAVFSGSFASGIDPETGERARYTISNFTITAEDKNYVGLFGTVFADLSAESSGLIYGICLDNFTISAGVNGMQKEEKSVSCGSLVGYSVGANFYLCDATNGQINVVADNNYFSFVGGLVGYQQGSYNEAYDIYNPTEISYANVDVDVNILGGVALYAGGITGFLGTNYPYGATAAIHNSYANGSVSGALRSGGIVGGLGRYSVVSNCYASGEVTARSYQPADSLLLTSTEYCHAYAGGIAGYAENDTIAHDSFFNGSASAFTASDNISNDYAHSDNLIGGGDPASFASADGEKYLAYNCHANVDLSNESFLTETLGWANYNWVFLSGKLPLINYASTEATISLSLTIKYVAPDANTEVTVQGKKESTNKYFDTSIQSLNSYNPIGSFIGSGSLARYYQADNSVLRSYGYYFDEACTKKVPLSYMPMKDITLYVGFTDPTPVVDAYYLLAPTNSTPLKLELKADGTAVYDDGSTTLNALYAYDGKRVILEGVRLARYYDGKIEINEQDTTSFQDENFDSNRYSLYNFAGVMVNGEMHLFDGTYFTESNPLVATKNALRGEYYDESGNAYFFYGNTALVKNTVGEKEYAVRLEGNDVKLTLGNEEKTIAKSALKKYDAFKGSWVKSSTVDKTYFFDGKGNWSYKQIATERKGYYGIDTSGTLVYLPTLFNQVEKEAASGAYTIVDDSITFTHGGVTYVAQFDSDGFLELLGSDNSTQRYYAENSFQGRWMGTDFDLVLSGIRKDGYGHASLITKEGFTTELLYEVSETSGIIALYYPLNDDKYKTLSKDYLYGYASYWTEENVLSLVSPDTEGTAGQIRSRLYLYDDYYGEWVCEHSDLSDVNLDFNGLGLYSHLEMSGLTGILTISDGNEQTKITYTLDSALSGKFSYKNKTYQITFDENDGTVKVVIVGSDNTLLERKDEFAGLKLVDKSGTEFCEIDGRSTLTAGGSLTFKGTDYRYFEGADGYVVKAKATDDVVGSIVKEDNHYLLTLGNEKTELYTANKFMGKWAIGGQYALFEIGPTDLNGVVQATFKGTPVELTYLDPATLTFYYKENKMPYTYYVFVVEDEQTNSNVLVVSEFTNFMLGEYLLCSKANELFGTWEWNQDNGKTTMRFDGITSGYANGYAELILTLNHSKIVTPYYYSIREEGIVFWSREAMAERTWYFRLDVVDNSHAEDSDAFVLYDEKGNVQKVMKRAKVDGLYLTEAYGENEEKYLFDGEGNMLLFVDDKLSDTIKYYYVIKSYNSDRTATLEVTDKATGVKYSATLDYSDATHIEFILGDPITE